MQKRDGMSATPGKNVEDERVVAWLLQVWANHAQRSRQMYDRVARERWSKPHLDAAMERVANLERLTRKHAEQIAANLHSIQGYTKVAVETRYGYVLPRTSASLRCYNIDADGRPRGARIAVEDYGEPDLGSVPEKAVVSCTSEGDYWNITIESVCLVATTSNVVLEKYILGPYDVIMYPWYDSSYLSQIDFEPLAQSGDPFRTMHNRHPHWRDTHHTCWGSFKPIIIDFMKRGLIIEQLNVLRRFLNSYTAGDCLVSVENMDHVWGRPTGVARRVKWDRALGQYVRVPVSDMFAPPPGSLNFRNMGHRRDDQ